MERPRILFVDDEQNILQALRRMLRPLRDEWDVSFAVSGEDAMAECVQAPYDIVVSDMRMPGISGADLLRWVAEEYPDTLRIILSGQSDQEGVLRSVGPAHQFLSKPCEPEMLIETIRRACELRDLLAGPDLTSLVSQLGTLPSLPGVYAELVEELQSPEPSSERIGDLVGSDMAMSAKLLQLVNSAFFGMPRRVTSPVEATRLLGLSTVKSLVLTAGAFASMSADQVDIALLERLWGQSLSVSGVALRIVELEGGSEDDLDAAVGAGLLHDIGKLILITCAGDDYLQILSQAAQQNISTTDAELSLLGVTHAEVGAYLLGTWGIPIPVVEAVAHHHNPGRVSAPSFGALTAVHVAEVITRQQEVSEASQDGGIDEEYLAAVGKLDRLPLWRSACEQTYEDVSA